MFYKYRVKNGKNIWKIYICLFFVAIAKILNNIDFIIILKIIYNKIINIIIVTLFVNATMQTKLEIKILNINK